MNPRWLWMGWCAAWMSYAALHGSILLALLFAVFGAIAQTAIPK